MHSKNVQYDPILVKIIKINIRTTGELASPNAFDCLSPKTLTNTEVQVRLFSVEALLEGFPSEFKCTSLGFNRRNVQLYRIRGKRTSPRNHFSKFSGSHLLSDGSVEMLFGCKRQQIQQQLNKDVNYPTQIGGIRRFPCWLTQWHRDILKDSRAFFPLCSLYSTGL